MSADDRDQALRALLAAQDVASLGTLHGGEPFVSMVPYALLPDGCLAVHVSRLATHTRDMLDHPGVSLMVMAPRAADGLPQELARVTFQCRAQQCMPGEPAYAAARQAYLSRFPQSEPMFGFADFSLFVLAVRSARVVGGFAQAYSLAGEALARALADAAAAATAVGQ